MTHFKITPNIDVIQILEKFMFVFKSAVLKHEVFNLNHALVFIKRRVIGHDLFFKGKIPENNSSLMTMV